VFYQSLVETAKMPFLPFSQERGFIRTQQKSTLFTVLIWANIMCVFLTKIEDFPWSARGESTKKY
jgi:hypothetical protein